MVNQSDLEIHNQLVRYLANEISLAEFRDWFDQTTWDVDLQGNPAASELAAEIELRLAEFSNGHRDEADLRRILRPLVKTFWTSSTYVTGTSATDLMLVPIGLGSGADISISLISA
jgi:hypothetical protein